ncbi:lipocalin family protein [Bacillus tianshenii]|nr:lipocalin family protein [Bacillus tianshenii]
MLARVNLPKDAGPHASSNVEWWYFFTFLDGHKGSKFALMASFFRVGESDCIKGHYLIHSLIDLKAKTQKNFSGIDKKLYLQMLGFYLPSYLLFHPSNMQMWKLSKQLLTKHLPRPHTLLKDISIGRNPTELCYGEAKLSFQDEEKGTFQVKMKAKSNFINLTFTPTKPVALIGGDGKPSDLYYYSYTRNDVEGQIKRRHTIENLKGEGWFDHQWGRDYGLLKDRGWNWFGLQLDDGRELLISETRLIKTGKTSSHMANLISQDGSLQFTDNVAIEPLSYWTSLKTGAKYPINWRIRIPAFQMEINVEAIFNAQEMPIIGPLQAIWEGACTVIGDEALPNGQLVKLKGKRIYRASRLS